MSTKPEPIILGTVKDERSRVYDVVIRFDGEQPTIEFKAAQSPSYTFFLTTLLERNLEQLADRARRGLWLDAGANIRLAPAVVEDVVLKAQRAIPPSVGTFSVAWSPTDPNCPF